MDICKLLHLGNKTVPKGLTAINQVPLPAPNRQRIESGGRS